MAGKYQAVIFDLDGTLLDTLEDLKDALNYALSACGFPERTLEEVRTFVGNGIKNLIERGLPAEHTQQETEEALTAFRAYYLVHCTDKTKPYPGVSAMLRELRENGVRIGVVSNKADAAVQPLCRRYFPGLIDCAIGEREGIRRKPAPDTVLEAMRMLDVSAESAVYVGDSEVDIETAGNAGLGCITVTWGFRDRDFLAARGAVQFADDTPELMRMLLSQKG